MSITHHTTTDTKTTKSDAWIKYPGWFLFYYLLISQGVPALNYEWGIQMGTQDPPDVVTPIGTAFWYGFCLADLVLYIPLLGAGLYRRNEAVGLLLLAAALGITAYWPIVCLAAAISAREMEGWNLDDRPFVVVLPIILIWAIAGFNWCVRQVKNDEHSDGVFKKIE